jgi:riboflavin biosynthesis pyrimidine reductase
MRLRPLQSLITSQIGQAIPLTPALKRLYGTLNISEGKGRPHVFSNFVSTVDGVVSLGVPGHSGGGDISGFAAQDRFVMGLLRAVADVVIVGAGALSGDRAHVWTAQTICPSFKSEFRALEAKLRKDGSPLNVIVSGSGAIDLKLPVFTSGQVNTVVLTTGKGAKRLARQRVPTPTRIVVLPSRTEHLTAAAILRAVQKLNPGRRYLIEGGPQLLASFYKARLIDEQFLTIAAQISGRQVGDKRLGLVMGQIFGPRDPLWGALTDLRSGRGLLFLRYVFKEAYKLRGVRTHRASASPV